MAFKPLPTGYNPNPSYQAEEAPPPLVENQDQYQLSSQPPTQELQEPEAWNYQTATAGPNGETLPAGAIGWRPDGSPDFGTGVNAWAQKSYWRISSGWMKGWAQGEQIAKTAGYENDFMPRLASAWGATKGIGAALAEGILSPLGLLSQWTEQGIGSLGFAMHDWQAGREINWGDNWEASRVYYGTSFNSWMGKGIGVRDEFISRMNNGERPDLIAEDLQVRGAINPWVEMGGQIILDPLNALDFLGWVGKGGRALHYAKIVNADMNVVEAGNMMQNVVDAVKAGDDIASAKNLARAVDEEIAMLDRAKAMSTALRKPGKITNLSELPERARELAKLTPESRRTYTTNRTGMVAERLYSDVGKNPDRMLELLHTVNDAVSGADDVRRAAVVHLFDLVDNPNLIFSKAGNDFMVLVPELMQRHGDTLIQAFGKEKKLASMFEKASKSLNKLGDGTWLERLNKLTIRRNDLTELVAKAAGQMDMFPDLPSASANKIKKWGEAIDEVSKKIGKLDELAIANDKKAQSLIAELERIGNAPINTPEENAALLIRMMDSTTSDLYPTAGEMLKAKKLVASGTEVSERVKELATLADQMTPLERKIGEIHNLAQEGLVGPLNKVFAKIYLGLSPGYAFRNLLQNNVQAFLDYGPDILFGVDRVIEGSDSIYNLSAKLNGGTPIFAGENFGVDAYQRILGKHEGTDFFTVFKRFLKHPDMREVAAGAEANMSRRIVGKTYVRSFRQAMTPLVDSLAKDKRFANLTPELRSILKEELYKNFGDAEAAVKAIREYAKAGGRNVFQDYSRIPKGLRDFAEGIEGGESALRLAIAQPDAEKSWKIFEQFFDAAQANGSTAFFENIPADLNDPLGKAIALGLEDESLGTATSKVWQVRRYVTNIVVEKIDEIATKVYGAGKSVGIDTFDFKKEIMAGWTTKYEKVENGRDFAVGVLKNRKNYADGWEKLKPIIGVQGNAPLTYGEFRSAVWDRLQQFSHEEWTSQNLEKVKLLGKYIQDSKALGVEIPPDQLALYDQLVQYADNLSNLVVGEGKSLHVEAAPLAGTRKSQIAQIAKKYGIETATAEGIPLDKKTLSIINKYAETDFTSLDDLIDLNMVERAFANATGVKDLPTVDINPVLPPLLAHQSPTPQRAILSDLDVWRTQAKKYVENNFGKVEGVQTADIDWEELTKVLNGRVSEVRATSAAVAQANRDFTLLNYGSKTYGDVARSYIMPYQKWYAGTYSNYAKRLMYNPSIFSHYGTYKEQMSLIHAGLPDWWRYNLSTADLPDGLQNFLGIEDNPLMFNLEATLWPLNGITGVDFNDPEKTVNWWTFAMSELGKFGPSIWTPLTLATGLYLRASGYEEAGERWIGRTSSITETIKTTTGYEVDPLVYLFEGGSTPYEDRRVRFALGQIIMQNPGNQELQAQAIDAANSRSGPLWEQAQKMALESRKGGNLAATLFGVGFKARTMGEMEADKFYKEYANLMSVRHNIAPDEFRNQMALLGKKYPFMDVMLIGAKSGQARDAAFAYNVLSRIPPGDMGPLLEIVGVRQDSIDYFYEKKGDLSEMSPDDKMRWNAGMLSLAAILNVPKTSTRQEWNYSKTLYAEMQTQVGLTDENGNPTDLAMKYQNYLELMEADRHQATLYLESHPELQFALDQRNAFIANNPVLNAYYGGFETIEKYYQSLARTTLTKKYGEDIYKKYDYYVGIIDQKAKKAYAKSHPEVLDFQKEKNLYQDQVNKKTAEMAAMMPEGNVELREAQTTTQDLLSENVLVPQRNVSGQEIVSAMRPELQNVVMTWMQQGGQLPYAARQQLDFLGKQYGLTANEILQILLSEAGNPP